MLQYLLSRVSTEEFAIYPVIMSLMVFSQIVFRFFTGGLSRFVVDAYAKGDFYRVSEITSSAFPMLLLGSTIFFVTGTLFGVNIDLFLNIGHEYVYIARIMFVLLIISFSLQMLCIPFKVGFDVKQKYVELNILNSFRDIFKVILIFCLLIFVGPSVIWIVVGTVIADVIHTAVVFYRSRALVPELRFSHALIRWKQATQIVSFGAWTTLGRLGALMYTTGATILLNLFGTPLDVTNFYLGSTLFRHINALIGFAALPLQPAITAMNSLNDHQRLKNTVLRGGRYATWIGLAVALPLAIFSEELITVYLGSEFLKSAIVLALFMAFFPFILPTFLLPMTAMAMFKVKEFYIVAFVAQLLGFLVMIYVTAGLNMGAIAVTACLFAVTAISQIFFFWPLCCRLVKISRSEVFWDLVYPGFLPAVAGSIVWIGFKVVYPPDSWLTLFAYGAAGGLVYLATLFAFSLNSQERRELRTVIDKTSLRLGAE